jgi:hypothetical protein
MMPAAFPEVLIAIRGQALLRLRSLGYRGRKTWLSASGIFIPIVGCLVCLRRTGSGFVLTNQELKKVKIGRSQASVFAILPCGLPLLG